MRLLTFLTAVAISFNAFALELVYLPDFSQMPEQDINSLDICGYPAEFKMDASLPIGPTFIKQLFWGDVSSERIQANGGSVSGGNLAPAFSGDYRTKVYIVKQSFEGTGYTSGVYNRVEVNTYGSTAAPSGMTVSTELLNYRESAELAEGSDCGTIYYKLQ
ncbi:MAG: hypothetical protein HRT44_14080 [Bdellovibrionales bacterium]|nr:hypothetical protein [Bdellovibrionales bacterium]NQZ20366.1 hypothetical protein [Bdellovibrionales bacterium]